MEGRKGQRHAECREELEMRGMRDAIRIESVGQAAEQRRCRGVS